MQIGIQLPEAERFVPWTEYQQMAVAAEEAGFDSVWLGDHLIYDKPEGPIGPWECWTLLAAIAAVTDRVLLGPLVTPTGFRNPAMLAKMAATVDEISGGRLILGLGSGWNRREYDAFGFPFDRRVTRFEEDFAVIVDLIRRGRSDFTGSYQSQDNNHLVPPARSELPIMIGSTGPRMLSITAGEMDWWNEWWSRFDNDPENLKEYVEQVDAALAASGRDPSEVTKSVALLVSMPDGEGRVMGNTDVSTPITGTSSEIAEQLLAFSGMVDHIQLVVDPITIESIRDLAEVVHLVHRE